MPSLHEGTAVDLMNLEIFNRLSNKMNNFKVNFELEY